MKLWIVTYESKHVILSALTREDAKRKSLEDLKGNLDEYIITPLTAEGDNVYLNLKINLDVNSR